jgi:hypothetical protein
VKKIYAGAAVVACLVIGVWLGWKRSEHPPTQAATEQLASGARAKVQNDPARSEHARPPSFRSQASTASGLITDPKAPGYDPFMLAQAGVPEPEIFAAEPRDPIWAPAMEANLRGLIEGDLAALAPGAKLKALECRTLSCELSVGGDDESLKIAASALQIGAISRRMRFGKNTKDGGGFDVTLIMDGEVRDPTNWVKLVSQSRQRHLAALRASGEKTLYNLTAVPAQVGTQ